MAKYQTVGEEQNSLLGLQMNLSDPEQGTGLATSDAAPAPRSRALRLTGVVAALALLSGAAYVGARSVYTPNMASEPITATLNSNKASKPMLVKSSHPSFATKRFDDAPTLGVKGRIFETLEDCENNGVALPGVKMEFSAAAGMCMEQDVKVDGNGDADPTGVSLQCNEDGQMVLSRWMDNSCSLLEDNVLLTPGATVCVETVTGPNGEKGYAQLTASSCDGEFAADNSFDAYYHSAATEKNAILTSMDKRGMMQSQRLEAAGMKASADSVAAAAAYEKANKAALDQLHPALRREAVSPINFEFAKMVHPSSQKAFEAYGAALGKKDYTVNPMTDAEKAKQLFGAEPHAMSLYDTNGASSWLNTCVIVGFSVDILFFTGEWSDDTCNLHMGGTSYRTQEYDTSCTGLQAGISLGFSGYAGTAFFKHREDIPGESMTLATGDIIDTGFDVDVSISAVMSTDWNLIAIGTDIGMGVSIGFSALSFSWCETEED